MDITDFANRFKDTNVEIKLREIFPIIFRITEFNFKDYFTFAKNEIQNKCSGLYYPPTFVYSLYYKKLDELVNCISYAFNSINYVGTNYTEYNKFILDLAEKYRNEFIEVFDEFEIDGPIEEEKYNSDNDYYNAFKALIKRKESKKLDIVGINIDNNIKITKQLANKVIDVVNNSNEILDIEKEIFRNWLLTLILD